MASSSSDPKSHSALSNANFPLDPEGRTMHLNIKRGDIAHRIVSVGAVGRAAKLAAMLDGFAESPSRVAVVHSSRGFVTHTGTFGGVPVSIIATGMGLAMADFVARELRACVDATAADPVLLVRLGTCGSMAPNVPVGSVAVANLGSISVRRNPSAFGGYDEASASTEAPYLFYAPIASDAALNEQLLAAYAANPLVAARVVPCLNATADSFYSSQGRTDANFDDRNETLIDEIIAKFPAATTLEMETFQFLDLARNCLPRGCFRATATTIVLAQRRSNAFIEPAVAEMLEEECGRAVLTAIAAAK